MADAARYVILVLGTLQLLLSSGLVLGWMGFVLMFRGEGIFSADCSADERYSGACDKGEELALTTIYTAGLAGKTMSPLPLGLIIDRCESPRLVGVVFAVGTTLGFFLLAVSDSQGIIAFGVWLFSFFGSGIQLNLFQVASLFPDAKGLVMGWFTTLFGFSALVPMMLFRVWEWLDSPSDARSTLFLWYSALLCTFVAFSATIGVKFNDGDRVRWGWRGFEIVPEVAIPSPPQRTMSRRVSVVGVTISQHLTPLNLPQAIQEGKDTKTSGCTEVACTVDYKVFLLFFTLHFFRSLFYLGAVDSQVTSIAGSTVRSSTITNILSALESLRNVRISCEVKGRSCATDSPRTGAVCGNQWLDQTVRDTSWPADRPYHTPPQRCWSGIRRQPRSGHFCFARLCSCRRSLLASSSCIRRSCFGRRERNHHDVYIY